MSLSKLWRWWWTGMPGMLQSMESQGVGQDWATEQQQLVPGGKLFFVIRWEKEIGVG